MLDTWRPREAGEPPDGFYRRTAEFFIALQRMHPQSAIKELSEVAAVPWC